MNVEARYIHEWDTQQQRVHHAPPQIGDKPCDHAGTVQSLESMSNAIVLDIMAMCSN